jgi:hypothetical protein
LSTIFTSISARSARSLAITHLFAVETVGREAARSVDCRSVNSIPPLSAHPYPVSLSLSLSHYLLVFFRNSIVFWSKITTTFHRHSHSLSLFYHHHRPTQHVFVVSATVSLSTQTRQSHTDLNPLPLPLLLALLQKSPPTSTFSSARSTPSPLSPSSPAHLVEWFKPETPFSGCCS